MKKEGSLLLSEYAAEIVATDVLDSHDFNPVLQGLYGEVGGIMATAKKMYERERHTLVLGGRQRKNLATLFGI